jgi:hypothetical protein
MAITASTGLRKSRPKKAAGAGEGGLLDVQQRQALDRADVHARAGDVGELGGHHQIYAGALQGPRQPA